MTLGFAQCARRLQPWTVALVQWSSWCCCTLLTIPPSFAACSHSMPARRGSKRGRQYLLDAKQAPTHALASRQKRTRSTQSHSSSSSSITTGSTSICSTASSGGGAGGSAGASSIASGAIEFSVVLADATTLHEATWWFAHYHRMLRRRRGSLRAYRGQDAVRNSTCIVLYMHCAAKRLTLCTYRTHQQEDLCFICKDGAVRSPPHHTHDGCSDHLVLFQVAPWCCVTFTMVLAPRRTTRLVWDFVCLAPPRPGCALGMPAPLVVTGPTSPAASAQTQLVPR